MTSDAPACVNCGAALGGPYCAACGQRTRNRVTVGGLLRDGIEGFTSLEHGFDRTVLDLLTRPGAMIRDYLRGRTRPYTAPLKFAIIAAALAMLVTMWLDVLDAERYQVIGWNISPEMDAQITAVNEMYLRFMNLFLMLMIPVSALATSAAYRREHLTLGEHVVFNAYVFGIVTLLGALLTVPLFFGLGGGGVARAAAVGVWTLGYFIYFVVCCVAFFRGGLLRRVVAGLVAGTAAWVAYGLVTMGGMLGYAWLRTLG